MKYNFISDKHLKDSIPHFKKKIFKEGQYIYDEFNFATHFHILIKGKICILSNKINNFLFEEKKNNFYITENLSNY